MTRIRPVDKFSASLSSFVVILALLLQGTAAAQPAEREIYSLGTSTTDGISHPLGVTIAALIKLRLLPEANIDIDARNTEGSRDNANRLRNADVDFAILTNLDAFDASRGIGPFADEGLDPSLRLVTNLWTSAYYFVVRREYAPTGSFVDFLNLRGRNVALGENGSNLESHARAMFAALDVDVDEAYRLEGLGGQEAARAFLDGDLDGFLLIDERQGADLAAFLDEAGDQAVALTVENDDIETIKNDGAPVWTSVTLPARTLPNQPEDHTTIGMHNLLSANENVADRAVYQITRTIFDNLPFLSEMHSATVGISLEAALDQLVVPVHSGAATYYQEVGVTIPAPEPVRISALSQTPFLTRFNSVQNARARLNDNTITVLGGAAGQTITRMTSELAGSFGDTDIRVVGMTSPWPAENIADVLYARGVDSAVVPLDILDYALEQNVYPDIRGKIAYATELFTEEVHLLASGNVQGIEDLVDQPVNLGPRRSASAFTASFLLDRLNLPVEPTYYDQRTALTLLERGELAAAFLIAGKPMPLLVDVSKDAGLRLIDIPPLEGDAYRPAKIDAADYPGPAGRRRRHRDVWREDRARQL